MDPAKSLNIKLDPIKVTEISKESWKNWNAVSFTLQHQYTD